MDNRDRILERIRKMLALANDSAASEGERDNAMRMAHATLAKYNLDLATVEKHASAKKEGAAAGEPRVDTPATFYGRPWARNVCMSIADLCFCTYLYVGAEKAKDTRHYFIGRQANATTAALLAEYVVNSIMREGKRAQRSADEGNAYFRSFAWGAALKIRDRVRQLKDDSAQQTADPNATPGTALVLRSVYEQEAEANKQYVATRFGALGRGRGGKGFGTGEAFQRGQAYGATVSLSRQVR